MTASLLILFVVLLHRRRAKQRADGRPHRPECAPASGDDPAMTRSSALARGNSAVCRSERESAVGRGADGNGHLLYQEAHSGLNREVVEKGGVVRN